MAPDRLRSNTPGNRILEALPVAASDLGWDVREFLGSDPLVMADGERPRSRADGGPGAPRSEIAFLRNRFSRQSNAILTTSTADCDSAVGRAHALAFAGLRNHCLDRLRFHRVGGPAAFMDQS